MLGNRFFYSGRIVVVLAIAVWVIAGLVVSLPAWGGSFPEKGRTIQIILGYTSGGPSDVMARFMANGLEKELGTSVVVVNMPGADSQIGYTTVSQAKPDGYTLGVVFFPPGILLQMQDPVRKVVFNRDSFQLLANHVKDPLLLAVKKDSPFQTMKDLIEFAKANPYKVRISTTGVPSDENLMLLKLQEIAGVKFALVHFSTGVGQAIPAFLGGKIEVYAGNVSDKTVASQSKVGEVRVLGIADYNESVYYPGVKTFAEQGYKVYSLNYRGYFAPAGMPNDVVDNLSGAMKRVMLSEDHKKRMTEGGFTIHYLDPTQFRKLWDEESESLKRYFK
jgi:tripartite-type tricarboxylate transporter receptor subunit TctC